MAQAVSCKPATVEDRVQSHVIACRVCSRQSGTGPGLSQQTSVFPPLSRISERLILNILTLLLLEQTGDNWKASNKTMFFGISRDKYCQFHVSVGYSVN